MEILLENEVRVCLALTEIEQDEGKLDDKQEISGIYYIVE